jgi:hypothetical protein
MKESGEIKNFANGQNFLSITGKHHQNLELNALLRTAVLIKLTDTRSNESYYDLSSSLSHQTRDMCKAIIRLTPSYTAHK